MYMKQGDKVITLIGKFEYPKGTKGIIYKFEKESVLVEVYLNGNEDPDDIIRYKYSQIESKEW